MKRKKTIIEGKTIQEVVVTGREIIVKEDKLIMVATDGRRLSYIEKEIAQKINDFPSAIVPTKVLNSVLKNAPAEGNIYFAVVDKMIFVKFGNYEYSSLLLDGQFPNYNRVIPENQASSFSVDKKELESALKRMSILIDKKVARVIFKLQSGVLTLISPESDLGNADEEIPCQYDGSEITMALNYISIEEPLKVISTERITFEFTESSKPITIKSNPESDYFHIVMPMNLD